MRSRATPQAAQVKGPSVVMVTVCVPRAHTVGVSAAPAQLLGGGPRGRAHGGRSVGCWLQGQAWLSRVEAPRPPSFAPGGPSAQAGQRPCPLGGSAGGSLRPSSVTLPKTLSPIPAATGLSWGPGRARPHLSWSPCSSHGRTPSNMTGITTLGAVTNVTVFEVTHPSASQHAKHFTPKLCASPVTAES